MGANPIRVMENTRSVYGRDKEVRRHPNLQSSHLAATKTGDSAVLGIDGGFCTQ